MSKHCMARAARGLIFAAIVGAAGAAAAAEYVNGARVAGAEPGEWTHDWDAATAAAKASGKPVFVNFTGSDWCGWCKLLKRQVFTQPEWGAWASNHVYLVHLDFPNDKALVPEKYRERNRELSRRYKVGGYPTCFLLDPATLEPVGRFGASRDASAADFVEKVSAAMPGARKSPEAAPSSPAPRRSGGPGPVRSAASGPVFQIVNGVLTGATTGDAEQIVVPEGVRTVCIDGLVFGRLKSLTIPEGVESLSRHSGGYRPGTELEIVRIPASVTSIRPTAFDGHWRRLRTIEIAPGSPFAMRDGCLIDTRDSSLVFALPGRDRIVVPDGVKVLGDWAFNANDVREIVVPEGVVKIGRGAFDDCRSLERLGLPASVEEIGKNAFSNCGKMNRIDVAPGNPRYSSRDGFLVDGKTGTLLRAFGRHVRVTIPASVTTIGERAFSFLDSLESATIPGSVRRIEDGAFSYCKNLQSLRLPERLDFYDSHFIMGCSKLEKVQLPAGLETVHGNYSFGGCSALRELVLPEGVRTIGSGGLGAVYECENLERIFVPSSVSTIAGGAFSKNPKLRTIDVHPDNADFCSKDGVLFTKDMTRLVRCPEAKKGVYEVPRTVATIDTKAFSGCRDLTEIRIPESVHVFGPSAFNDCPAKTNRVTSSAGNAKVAGPSPELRRPSPSRPAPPPATPRAERPAPPTGTAGAREPEFVIEYGILRGVKPNGEAEAVVPAETRVAYIDRIRNVRRIVLSEGIESIRRGGMDLDSRATLESVSIPKSVREIQPGVFNGSFRKLSSIEIAHGSPFSMDGGCLVDKRDGTLLFALPGRERIIVPNGVRAIADHALDGNGDVREVILPEGVRTIGRSAFAWCTALEFVAIPSSLREIGSDAFNHCRALSKLRIPDSVTAIGRGAFEDCPARTIRVHAIDLSTAPSRAADPPAAKDPGGLVAAEMPLLKFPREGLVAEFVFNDENKARDLAKEGRTFKLRRAASARPVELDSLVTNGALRLTGDYFGKEANITHLDVPELRYDRFTVATSFRPERDPEKSTPLVSFGGGWRWFHILLRGDGTPLVQFRGLAKGELSFPLSEPLRQDEWNWLAVSFDASRRRVSVVLNGKRIPDIVLPEDFAFRLDRQDRDQSRTVQFANTNNGTVFKGAIKSFLLFDRALTDAEIESIAVASTEPPTQWTFLPGEGEDAFWNGRVSDGSVRLPARVGNGAAAVGFPDRLDPPNGLLDLSKPVVDASGNTVPLVGIGQKEKRSPSANSGIPKGVTEVRLPETLRWIGPGAFQGFRSLRTLRIPASVKRIGAAAFADCPALERIEFEDASFKLDDRVFGIPRKGEKTRRPATNLPKE